MRDGARSGLSILPALADSVAAAPVGGQDAGLKMALHRHLIDAVEQDGIDITQWVRSSVSHYVAEKVARYITDRELAVSRYEQDLLVEEMVDELVGFGPIERLLADRRVTEILINGPHNVFVERDGRLQPCDQSFMDDAHVLRVVRRILAPVGRRLDEASPMVDARLPDGSRINAIIPPLSLEGPCVSIRKFSVDFFSSGDLLAQGSIDESLLRLLRAAVANRCNIMVSGGTGTGKTTLLNILSGYIDPAERVVTIEDTAELKLSHEHVVRLETRPANLEGHGAVGARELVRNALRMRPDRLVLGEVRGNEVLDMLQAMNTGHDGSMTTVHANSAEDALLRLEMLVGLTGHHVQERTLRQMIGAALDLVVHVNRLPGGRRLVSEVVEVSGARDGTYVTTSLCRYDDATARFLFTGSRPQAARLRAAVDDVGGR